MPREKPLYHDTLSSVRARATELFPGELLFGPTKVAKILGRSRAWVYRHYGSFNSMTVEQNIEDRIGVPALWRADFALTCHGNSMAAMIQDGDIVCIRKQPEVENGEIAAVRIGEEATLKRFYRQGDTVMLQAENPAFSPLVYTRDQLNEITIEGRVVGICRGI